MKIKNFTLPIWTLTMCLLYFGSLSQILAQGFSLLSEPNNLPIFGIYAVGAPNSIETPVFAVGMGGVIKKSVDGGHSWTLQNSGVTTALNDVLFIDKFSGWAVGDGGVILRTSNEGASWVPTVIPGMPQLRSIDRYTFNDPLWVVGTNGSIYKSTNEGVSWVAQTTNTIQDFYDVVALNSSTIIAVGTQGTICRSTNGGATWTTSTVGVSSVLRSVSGFSSVLFAVGTAGGIYKSVNSGQSWTSMSSGTTNVLFDVKRIGSTTFASGNQGTLLKTTDSQNWVSVPTGSADSFNALTFRGTDNNIHLWVAGSKANLLSTNINGSCVSPSTVLLTSSNLSVCVGESITLSALNLGSFGTRIWKKNGSALYINNNFNTHPRTLTINNAQLTDAGTYVVELTGPCGTVTSAAISVAVNIPQQPSTIIGTLSPAQNVSSAYSVSPIPGATFNWTAGGGTITGSGNAVQISWPTTGLKIITVTATDDCGTSSSRSLSPFVTSCATPVQPSAISINSGLECSSSTTTYSVTNVPGVSYTWSLSTGGTIVGSGNSATVTWNTTTGPRTITVTPSNACGNGTARTLNVSLGTAPAQPSAITGSTIVCTGVSTPYSVTNVSGVTYSWDIGNAGTVSGIGNAVNITWNSSGAKTLTVYASNSCGTATARTLAVTVGAAPAQPSGIVGSTTATQNQSTQYSITNEPGTTYTWNAGSGGTVTGSGNAVNISWTTTGAKTITVTPSTSCGSGTPRTLSVTVGASCTAPAQPSTITGNATVCTGSSGTYSVTPIDGVSYTWNAGVDGNVSGSGNSVNLIWTSIGTKTVTVTPFTDCGTGTPRTLTVVVSSLPVQPSAITGNTTACINSSNAYSVTNISGVSYIWDTGGKGTITGSGSSISVQWTAAGANTLTVIPSNGCGAGLAQSLSVTVNTLPAGTSVIAGSNLMCTGVSSTYAITNVSGVTYTWSAGAGGTVSGSGNSVSMSWSTGGEKTVQVTPQNECGNGATTTMTVSVTATVAQPGAISGSTAVDAGTTNTYSVPNVAGVNYAWSTSGDGTIITAGNSAQVSWTSGGSKTLTVTPSNLCGAGAVRSINVNVATPCVIPSTPSSVIITSGGTTNRLVGETIRVGVTFSSGATSYDLSVFPLTGITITPVTEGSLDITFANAGVYTITGKGVNACGTSGSALLSVNVCTASVTQPIVTGTTTNICPGSTTRYTVTSPIEGYSYEWLTGGAPGVTISYLNAQRSVADVTWNTNWTGVNLSVRARNACNTVSAYTDILINLVPKPGNPNISLGNSGGFCVGTGASLIVTLNSPEAGVDYNWVLNGAGTVSADKLTATIPYDGQARTIQTLGTNSCFVNEILNSLVFAGGTPVPIQPSPVVGPSTIDFNVDGTFTVEAQPVGVNFSWDAGADATITNTASPNSKLIRWSTGGTKTIYVSTVNGCTVGPSPFRAYSLYVVGPCDPPAIPDPISGASNGCANNEYIFSVPFQPNTTFNWSAGADATITGTGNTRTIKWSTSGPKVISVSATNGCSTSAVQEKTFGIIPTPAQPAGIAGGSLACAGETETFFPNSITGGVTYAWEIQGGTFTASGSQNEIVSITWSSAGSNIIKVKASNACGFSPERSITRVINTTPLQPSIINGEADVCVGIVKTYSVANVPGTTYTWNGGVGATVTGSGNSVTISWSTAGTKTITVTPSTDCGSGTARTLNVNVTGAPAQPSVIVGNASPVLGSAIVYTVTNLVGVNYTWSLTDKGLLTASGNSSSVFWNTPGNSTLSVTPSNACGNGTARTASITINKISQTITFTVISPMLANQTLSLNGEASSGLPVTYTSSNTSVAEIFGNELIIKSSGSVDITASQAGDETFAVASPVVRSLTINKANQLLTFDVLSASTYGDGDIELEGTSESGLPVAYSSSNTSVAIISGNILTIVGAGTADITATQGGDDLYNAATPIVRTLVVGKADQTIAFDPLSAKGINDPPFILTATASSELAVTYSSSNASVATISGSTVTIIGEGSTIITATQAGDVNYNAATPIEQTLVVNGKEGQTITFNTLPAKTFGDADFELNATASSNLVVSYTSSNTAVATVSGTTVTIVGAGSTTITASQSGNEIFNPATSIPQVLTVNKADQIITFATIPDQLLSTGTLVLSATSSAGLDISYSSSNTSVATVTGATLTFHSAGVTTITASQAGNSNFNAAIAIDQSLTITTKQSQAINFASLSSKTFGDAAFDLSASASSDLPVEFVSSNLSVATIDGNVVSIVGAGTTTITAKQAGNESFEAATDVSHDLVVAKANQTITFSTPASANFTTNTLSLEASSSAALAVSFASSNASLGTIDGNMLTFIAPGTLEITASQPGNANYNAASSVIASITIVEDRQNISLTGSLDFGNVLLGETEVKTITIANTGNAALQISAITLPEGFTSSVGATTVSANASITAEITFAPTELKDYEGSVVISSNAVNGNNALTLSGTGVTITGFNEPGQASGDLDVYPNPGTGVYIVKSKMTRNKSIAVMDMSGKAQYRILKSLDEEYHELDLLDLPEGIYYLKIEEKGSVAVKRIVKLN